MQIPANHKLDGAYSKESRTFVRGLVYSLRVADFPGQFFCAHGHPMEVCQKLTGARRAGREDASSLLDYVQACVKWFIKIHKALDLE